MVGAPAHNRRMAYAPSGLWSKICSAIPGRPRRDRPNRHLRVPGAFLLRKRPLDGRSPPFEILHRIRPHGHS